jgi:4,5-DOPA dioxygenase extradiol
MSVVVKKKSRLPALFISHGSPMVALQGEDAYSRSLHAYCAMLPERPKAIAIVSAHGLSPGDEGGRMGTVDVNASSRPVAFHDFRGFPGELYKLDYPCPGSPELAAQIAARLADEGFATALDRSAMLDHGVWVPLRALYPEADIPVVQLSMPYPARPETVLKLGKALAPLREEGCLVIGSGSMVHNLGKLVWHQKNGPAAPWAQEFDDWAFAQLRRKDVGALCAFMEQAPHARLAHPEPEHFNPIFFTLGASLPGDELRPIHREIQYSTLSMSCFALEGPEMTPDLGKDASSLM